MHKKTYLFYHREHKTKQRGNGQTERRLKKKGATKEESLCNSYELTTESLNIRAVKMLWNWAEKKIIVLNTFVIYGF